MGILVVLFNLVAVGSGPSPRGNPCAQWLEGAQQLKLDLASWSWQVPGIQLDPAGSVSYRNGLKTPAGLSWVRRSYGEIDDHFSEIVGSSSAFFEAELEDGRPTHIRVRDTQDTASVFLHGTQFSWSHLRQGVVPHRYEPVDTLITRSCRPSSCYGEGRLDFAYEENVVSIRQFSLAPPKNRLFGRFSGPYDLQPIQDLRLIRSKEGIVGIHSDEYGVAGTFQLATLAGPIVEALLRVEGELSLLAVSESFRDLEQLLADAQRRWERIRELVAGEFVVSKIYVPNEVQRGRPFLTGMTYSRERVARRDHYLNAIESSSGDQGQTYTFEVREMAFARQQGTFKVTSERAETAVFHVEVREGQTSVRRVETRTRRPGKKRSGFAEYPDFPQSLTLYFENTEESRPTLHLAPTPQVAHGAGLDRWFQQAVLLQMINTQGRRAVPVLDFMAP